MGMEMLVNRRGQCNIPSENPYFFSSKSYGGYLESCHAMSLATNSAELKQPQTVTSTKLRKYNATVCQVVDLSPVETEWLSNHMGHSLNIHKNFYRLHDSVIELAKVLEDMGIEELKVDEMEKGESDVEVEPDVDDTIFNTELAVCQQDESELLPESYCQVSSLPQLPHNRKRKRLDLVKARNTTKSKSSSVSDHEEGAKGNSSPDNPVPKMQALETVDVEYVQCRGKKRVRVVDTSSSDDDDDWSNERSYKRNYQKTKYTRMFDALDADKRSKHVSKSGRSPWTAEEVSVLQHHFGPLMKSQKYPSSAAIQSLIRREIISSHRTVLMVKAKLQTLMKMSRV